MKYRLIALPLCACFTVVFTSCTFSKEKETVEPQEVVQIENNASTSQINDQLEATPSSQEKNTETGISVDNYEEQDFAGYMGKMAVYYNEDGSVLYYKWFLNETDAKKAKEIYQDVCEALSGSYGDGTENNNETSKMYTTSFTNNNQQITAQMLGNDTGYEVSYMVVGQN